MSVIPVRRMGYGVLLGSVAILNLAGCDYWPPALQAQIEQLRTEVQQANMDRAQMQNQLTTLVREKGEFQARLDDLTRVNREKNNVISSLEHNLTVEREKVARLTKGGGSKPATKAPGKSATKPSSKPPTKKKSATHTGARPM